MFVVFGRVHADQLGAGREHGLNLFEIAGFHRFIKPGDRGSIDKGLQLGQLS
jgi:hypothetical protein